MTGIRRRTIGAAAILAVIGAGTGISRAQDAAGSLRRVGGPLDLSGVWQAPYVPDMTKDGPRQKGDPSLPFTPAGEKQWKSYDAANGEIEYSCEENNKDLREGHIKLWTPPGTGIAR